MPTRTPRNPERNGVVDRVVHPVVPPMVEDSSTPFGETPIEPLTAPRLRAKEHLSEVAQARREREGAAPGAQGRR